MIKELEFLKSLYRSRKQDHDSKSLDNNLNIENSILNDKSRFFQSKHISEQLVRKSQDLNLDNTDKLCSPIVFNYLPL